MTNKKVKNKYSFRQNQFAKRRIVENGELGMAMLRLASKKPVQLDKGESSVLQIVLWDASIPPIAEPKLREWNRREFV